MYKFSMASVRIGHFRPSSGFNSLAKCSIFHHRSLSSAMTTPRIAIVGGGPGGLTLGNLLHAHKIPFTIFELREKPSEEELDKPAGMLDLHEDSGLLALRDCGLYDKFLTLTGECSEQNILADKHGRILHIMESTGPERPEISRNNLTRLLLEKLPATQVKYGHKLVAASKPDPASTETVLDFGPNGKHIFDVVIGADGAWSKVRPLLTNVKPRYNNAIHITLTIIEITKKYPHLAELIGSGTFFAVGNRHAVVTQRGKYDSARVFLWLTITDENFPTTSGIAGKPALAAKELLLGDKSLYGEYGPVIKELISVALEEETKTNPASNVDIRALYELPHGTEWQHKPGVTLLGDAAHLMLPNGEGVNIAMLDAVLLSKAIVKAHERGGAMFLQELDPLIKQFEEDMARRTKPIGEETVKLIGMFQSDNAAEEFANFLKSARESPDTKPA